MSNISLHYFHRLCSPMPIEVSVKQSWRWDKSPLNGGGFRRFTKPWKRVDVVFHRDETDFIPWNSILLNVTSCHGALLNTWNTIENRLTCWCLRYTTTSLISRDEWMTHKVFPRNYRLISKGTARRYRHGSAATSHREHLLRNNRCCLFVSLARFGWTGFTWGSESDWPHI